VQLQRCNSLNRLHHRHVRRAASGFLPVNIDVQGVKSITKNDGATAPAGGAITAGKFYWLFYDGTVFQMQ
jgi:hypothetical protein